MLRVRRMAVFMALGGLAVLALFTSQQASMARAPEAFVDADKPGLVIGEFRLARKAILDGDTIRVAGLPKSLRLLGIDTEETFKSIQDRIDAENDFEAYLRAKRGNSPKPVKAATPMGEEAKRFAEDFFRGVSVVRLERDHPEEIRDYYGRFLAYVFVHKNGRWVNYNVEAVRAGMSPYFTKYGYSRRFHKEFMKAEEEARSARRGIWDPSKKHYRDYDERKVWWNRRAAFLDRMEKEGKGQDDFVILTRWNALDRLRALVGREATVVGVVGDIAQKDRVTIVRLSRRKGEDFPLVFYDNAVFERSKIERYQGEYVRVKGVVRIYKHPHRPEREEVEMLVERPEWVSGEVEGFGIVTEEE